MKTAEFLVALGANMPSAAGDPAKTLRAALDMLAARGFAVTAVARWRRTPAFPAGAGPDFVNGAAILQAAAAPEAALAALHAVEAELGRERRERWGPRVCDIDLIACGDLVAPDEATLRALMALGDAAQAAPAPDRLILPHPRMHERSFVLAPLADIAPQWKHPVLGLTVVEMLAERPAEERETVTLT